ncbi:MAG: DMT family transporter [Polyangiaceae bacterium]|nr:DMT family transporter [Polyangiaceae bacterium]MCB9606351.1 DMT family transporter [Polyangiaceae bacterium]
MNSHSNVTGSPRGALLWTFLGVVGFSGSLPATRAAVPYLGAVTVGLGRACVAGLLALLVLSWKRSPLPSLRQSLGLVQVALGVVVGFPLLSAYALERVPASHAALVVGLTPLLTAGWAVLRAGERVSVRFWAASGSATLVVLGFCLHSGEGRLSAADAWLLLGALVCAYGYAEGARLSRELGGFRVIAWALVIAWLPLCAVVARAGLPDLESVPLSAWLGFGYVSVVSMFLAFVVWYAGLAGAGIARASQLQLLQPLFSMALASWLLHESLPQGIWIAMAALIPLIVAANRSRGAVSARP